MSTVTFNAQPKAKVSFESIIETVFNSVATCTKPLAEGSKASYVGLLSIKEGIEVGFKEAKPLSTYRDTLAAARAARAAKK